jgi:hypothetical protein
VRAHNSKKNNYNPKKVQRHLDYIDAKTRDYMRLLDQQDALESKERITEVKKKLKQLNDTRLHYELLGEEMEMTGAVQVSTTDPDARALLVQGQVVEVCYNVQTAVDQEHKLVVAAQVINRNDRNALTDISKEAKANTEAEKVTVLSDKGYHNARELDQCQKENIQTICAQQEIVNSNEHGTTKAYLVNQFKYNPKQDTYTCPAGESLRTSGSWHQKTRERDRYRFKKYRTPTCMQCAVKHLCTGRAKGGREIERSEFAGAVEANAKRFKFNYDLYRKRQEINEHIFGTIKRKWGYGYTDLNGLEKVNGEYHLILLVYNLKRSMKILGHDLLLKKLQKLASEIPCKR